MPPCCEKFPTFSMKKLEGRFLARLIAVAALAFFIAVSMPGTVSGQPPAPQFMANSPILAGNQVIILWVPVPGAVKYFVYLNGKKIAEAVGVQHVIPTPAEAGEYTIELAAVDAAGKESPRSRPGTIKIVVIEAPKGLVSRARENTVFLRWGTTDGAVIYNLYRSDAKDGEFKLLASVQETSYGDSGVEPGKSYYYAVTAKDLAGKESPRSETVEASLLEVQAAAATEVKLELKIVPTQEASRVGFIEGKRVTQVSDVKVLRDRSEVWIVRASKIFRLNFKGELVGTIGPLEGAKKLIKVDVAEDGTIYVSDSSGYLYAVRESGAVAWKSQIPRPPADDEEIWKQIPAHVKSQNPVGGDVLAFSDGAWISDQRYAIICVFDSRGNFQRYSYSYTDKEGKKVRFPAVGEIDRLPGGDRYIITFPLGHYAVVVDQDFNEIYSIGKSGTGFIGRFIGIHGVDILPGGEILLTDPAVNSMQVFDGKEGTYLYHIGGSQAEEDPAQPGRALIDFGAISFTHYINDNEVIVYAGTEKALLFRKVLTKK